MLDDIALFNGMAQRMDWLSTRQRVISQNIANANTPDYRSSDLKPQDFKKTLGRYMDTMSLSDVPDRLSMATTTGAHMDTKLSVGRKEGGENDRKAYEITPDENAVSLEDQVMKATETSGNYQMIINLYTRHMTMLKTSISSK